jgi:hypothetical protein
LPVPTRPERSIPFDNSIKDSVLTVIPQ